MDWAGRTCLVLRGPAGNFRVRVLGRWARHPPTDLTLEARKPKAGASKGAFQRCSLYSFGVGALPPRASRLLRGAFGCGFSGGRHFRP